MISIACVEVFLEYTLYMYCHYFRPEPEIPTISVECTNVSAEYFNTIQYSMPSPELPIKKNKGFRSKKRAGASTFQSYVPQNEDDKELSHGRLPSSEGEGLTDGSSHHSSHGNSPFEGMTRPNDRVYSRGRTNLYKTPSVDSISTITSGVTLKAAQPFEEDITDLLRSEAQGRGLTEDRLKALSFSRSDNQKSNTKRYSKIRSNKHHGGGEGTRSEGDRREEWEQSSG